MKQNIKMSLSYYPGGWKTTLWFDLGYKNILKLKIKQKNK